MGHFYFVRHGQTIWNVENKICGATDIALTEYGHQQAIETGRKILEEGITADEILYSPLMRAADTARHLSEITGIPARMEPRLTEQNFGRWEGTARLISRRPRRNLPATMRAGSLCFDWLSAFIISWMKFEKSQRTRHTFL